MGKRSYNCGLEAALDVVGGKWKPIVLWHLGIGPRRFGELRRLVARHQREDADPAAQGDARGRDRHPRGLPRDPAQWSPIR